MQRKKIEEAKNSKIVQGTNVDDPNIIEISDHNISTCSIRKPGQAFQDTNILTYLKKLQKGTDAKSELVRVVQSSSKIKNPTDTSQLRMQFHHLYPSGRGFYGDPSREGTMSVDDYFRHLVQLSYAGFRGLFSIQFLYNLKSD